MVWMLFKTKATEQVYNIRITIEHLGSKCGVCNSGMHINVVTFEGNHCFLAKVNHVICGSADCSINSYTSFWYILVAPQENLGLRDLQGFGRAAIEQHVASEAWELGCLDGW